ncbi:MAG: hypothetical protein K2J39_09030, partial [Ruminococcus sp.]|nr:hypothetical protein [Ruminococcus sp.]
MLIRNNSICVVGAELFQMTYDFLDGAYRKVLCFVHIKSILKVPFLVVYDFDIACLTTPLV